MKRFSWILAIFAIVLCAGYGAPIVGQYPYPVDSVNVSMPEVNALAGEQVLIPVTLSDLNVEGLISFNIDVNYDPSAMDYNQITKGDFTGDWNINANPGGGKIQIGGYSAYSLSASGVLFYLSFTTHSDVAHNTVLPLTFSKTILNAGGYTVTTTGGSITVETAIFGDADNDGEVTAADAAEVLKESIGMPTSIVANRADVDGNGSIEAYDASLILQYVVKLIDTFPVQQ